MSLPPTKAAALPQIVTPRGTLVSVSDHDRLWLLRAVEAEGEPRDQIAQTLVNRWAWLFDETPGKYLTLSELVRAYAQPVNPAWYPDGKLFLKALDDLPEHEKAGAMVRARARRDVHSTRTTFSDATTRAVNQALYGPITLPPGALHFAAPSIERDDLPVLVPSTDARTNVIYGEARGRGANARYSVAPERRTSPPARASRTGQVLALVTLGLGVGFGIARLSK